VDRNALAPLGQLLRKTYSFLVTPRFDADLARAPAFSVAEMPEGVRGRLTGVVRQFAPDLEAPLSGHRCVYYHVVIQERRGGVHYDISSQQDAVLFVLEDRGHRAVIDPKHARFFAGIDHVSNSRAAFNASPAQLALLRHPSLTYRDWRLTGSLRYREAIIGIDGPVTVAGIATREPDPQAMPTGTYRESGPTRLWMQGTARYPLVIKQ
jgi:hypothetical protein